jgi:hypothetical protein
VINEHAPSKSLRVTVERERQSRVTITESANDVGKSGLHFGFRELHDAIQHDGPAGLACTEIVLTSHKDA